MDLIQKGQTAELSDTFKQIKLTASWTEAADLDIAALYEKKDGTKGLVYFGQLGDLNAFPFIKLDKDAGVGGKVASGGNQETMKVTKLDDMKTVHLLVWDYGKIETGEPGRFGGVKIALVDDTNASHTVQLDGANLANVVVLATIDNNSAVGPKLVNTSKFGVLKGLKKDQQLWDVANSDA
jgi:tellurite resistance protein TerA